MKTLIEKLNKIQIELNAPKDAFNSFSKYSYRSAESILQAVKPLLKETGLVLTLTDDVNIVGERIYIKSTATISDGTNKVESSSFAREPIAKKGSDESQITGAASSYARKYALCGLLAIDDNKDSDIAISQQPAGHSEQKSDNNKPFNLEVALKAISNASNVELLQRYLDSAIYRSEACHHSKIHKAYEARLSELTN